jgi:hypothetical protein
MKYYTAMKGNLAEKTKEDLNKESQEVEQSIANIFEEILKTIKVDVFN